jgi:hypothetical protein
VSFLAEQGRIDAARQALRPLRERFPADREVAALVAQLSP